MVLATASKEALKDKGDWKKMRSFTKVARVFCLVDVLKNVRDHSLSVQEVNVLPWEVARMCIAFHSQLEQTTTILREGKIDKTEFSFFHKHGSGILKEGKATGTVTLEGHSDYGKEHTFDLQL